MWDCDHPSVCHILLMTKPFSLTFTNFDTSVLDKQPSSNLDSCKNWRSNSRMRCEPEIFYAHLSCKLVLPLSESIHRAQRHSHYWKHLRNSLFVVLIGTVSYSASTFMISLTLRLFTWTFMSGNTETLERKSLTFEARCWRSLHMKVSFVSSCHPADGA